MIWGRLSFLGLAPMVLALVAVILPWSFYGLFVLVGLLGFPGLYGLMSAWVGTLDRRPLSSLASAGLYCGLIAVLFGAWIALGIFLGKPAEPPVHIPKNLVSEDWFIGLLALSESPLVFLDALVIYALLAFYFIGSSDSGDTTRPDAPPASLLFTNPLLVWAGSLLLAVGIHLVWSGVFHFAQRKESAAILELLDQLAPVQMANAGSPPDLKPEGKEVVGVCQPVPNTEGMLLNLNHSLFPAHNVSSYLWKSDPAYKRLPPRKREQLLETQVASAVVTLAVEPTFGKLVPTVEQFPDPMTNRFFYVPKPGYMGRDRLVYEVGLGGRQFRVVINLYAVDESPGPETYERVCGKRGSHYKIAS